jgi:hypothetical protein
MNKPASTCKIAQAIPQQTLKQLNEMKKKLPKGVDK